MVTSATNKMKVSALLLLVGASANAPPATLGYCTSLCKEARQSVLADIDICKNAIKNDPNNVKARDLVKECSKGRKKAFDQACIPLCTKAEMSVSSFESCQVIAKKGHKSVEWCRKVSGVSIGLQHSLPCLWQHFTILVITFYFRYTGLRLYLAKP